MTMVVIMRKYCMAAVLMFSILFTIYSKGLAIAANAQEAVLTLEPANTHIDYTLQGWPHVTHGTFHLIRGVIRIDPASGKTEGSVVVSAVSGDSGSSMRDDEMKDSILEAERYPEIIFTPQQAEGRRSSQGEFPATVHGILTLHGSPHEIALRLMVQSNGDGFSAATSFAVPYVAWGLKNPSLLIFRCADRFTSMSKRKDG
ncbi:MAG: YceI family protein [Candidatus Binataceae bacterium]